MWEFFNTIKSAVLPLVRSQQTLWHFSRWGKCDIAPIKRAYSVTTTDGRFHHPKTQRNIFLSRSLDKDISLLRLLRLHSRPRIILDTFFQSEYYIAFEALRENRAADTAASLQPRIKKSSPKMKFWLQFLSTPTADTPGTTLVLHFDTKRYLIGNIGEGTQRAAVQRKLGVLKLGEVFLTGPVGWDNVGGLLGMILTVADSAAYSREQIKAIEEKKKNNRRPNASKKNVSESVEEDKIGLGIHGGRNLTHFLATARRFIFRKGMPLRTAEFRCKKDEQRSNWNPTWEDELIKVWDMVIEPRPGNECISPRKRSHEEFSEDEFHHSTMDKTMETTEEIDNRYDQMRKSVLSSMFDSEWRLDALIKKKLSEVALPAAIFVRNAAGKVERYSGLLPGEGHDVSDVDVLVRNPWPGALVEELPPTSPSESSICYIIKGHPQRGKFNAKAAMDLGVPPGPDFRCLTMGESVTTASGKIVTPDMVLGETKEGPGFAVVELPSTSYIEPLLSRGEWSSEEVMVGVAAIIWILAPGVVKDARLLKFMAEHSELKHIVSSRDCCSNYLALESTAASAIRLNLLDPERFPIPTYNDSISQQYSEGQQPFERARLGLTLQLEPRVELQQANVVPYLDTDKVVSEVPEEVLELAKVSRAAVLSQEFQARLDENQKDIPSKDAEIVTLGTGSSLPSKYRNVSATLVRVPCFGTYLLDCGENTLGQLKRVYGDDLPQVLRDLKAIWISHLHADHHLGTTAVIKAWAAETARDDMTRDNKLHVVSHEGMINWLREYSGVENYGFERLETVVVGSASGRKFWTSDHQFESEQVKHVGISSLQACSVEHCHGAAAVVFNFPNGFKIAYSGDCRPSWEFVKIGQDATLLIHEATFDDELRSDAIAKKHSTTSEALDVGREMNARRILLTHFSQRYQKIPVMDSPEGKDQIAIVAFDYMRVKLKDFAKFGAFKPALMKLYEDVYEEKHK